MKRLALACALFGMSLLACGSREKEEAAHLLTTSRAELEELERLSQDVQKEIAAGRKVLDDENRKFEGMGQIAIKTKPVCEKAQGVARNLYKKLTDDPFEYRTKSVLSDHDALTRALMNFSQPGYGKVGGVKDCEHAGMLAGAACAAQCRDGFHSIGVSARLVASSAQRLKLEAPDFAGFPQGASPSPSAQ